MPAAVRRWRAGRRSRCNPAAEPRRLLRRAGRSSLPVPPPAGGSPSWCVVAGAVVVVVVGGTVVVVVGRGRVDRALGQRDRRRGGRRRDRRGGRGRRDRRWSSSARAVVVVVRRPGGNGRTRRRWRDGDGGTGTGVLQRRHVLDELRQVAVLGFLVRRQREGGLAERLGGVTAVLLGALERAGRRVVVVDEVVGGHAEVLLFHHAVRILRGVGGQRLRAAAAIAHQRSARVQPAVDVLADGESLQGAGGGAELVACG